MKFQDVDSQPEGRVSYLDGVTGLDAVQAIKQRSYSLLNLKPGHHVLEVGCGTGDDARAIARIVGSSGRVVGMDSSEIMINEAKKRNAGIDLPVEFQVGNVSKLSFDDDTFNATRADRVFQHLTNPPAALDEMIRVTRPGGRIGVIDPDWGTILVDASDKELTRRIFSASEFEGHVNPWMGRQLWAMFKNAGLEQLQISPGNVPILDYESAKLILDLQAYVDKALEKRVITKDESRKWLDDLEKRNRNGHFFSSLSGFGMFGTKPR